MFTKKDDKVFEKITFPKLSPEKAVGDYLRSKLEEKAVKIHPEWDVSRLEPIINLIQARNDVYETENKLEAKKEDAAKRRDYLDSQWEELNTEAQKLRNTFCEFDEMITQNIQKRERAIKQTEKQQKFQTEKDQEIKNLKDEYKKLHKIKEQMENQIKSHLIYEQFLNTVAEAYPDYKKGHDVYKKFAALDEARDILTKRIDDNITTLENLRDEFRQQLISHSIKLKGVHNQVTNLHKRYKIAKDETAKWESLVQTIQTECGERLIEILTVKRICWKMYLNICNRRHFKIRYKESDFASHLACIKKNLLQLKTITATAKENVKSDIESDYVEKPNSK